MRAIQLPYQFHATGLLPLCEVVILGRARRVPVRAVVDSGATHPFFPLSAAVDADLDLARARPLDVTFGGSITQGKLLDVYVELQGRRFRLDICFVDDLKLGYALLGRRTFFSRFSEVAFLERLEQPRVELRG